MFETIPEGLDEMPPGAGLAALLAEVDVRAVSGYDRIVVLRAHQRLVAHYAAEMYADMAAVADHLEEFSPDPEFVHEAASAEIGAALRLSRRAAEAEFGYALDLCRRLPRLWCLLASGEIDVRRAKVIVTGVSHLPVAAARAVVEEIIDRAPGLTTGQLAARLRKLCIEADPDEAARRFEASVGDRRVVTEATTEGTTNLLGLDLPPDRVAAATRRINDLARSLRTAGETRTMDQLRADVLLDLLTGTRHGTRRGAVDIQVDLTTLTELADHPGELAGFGPVIADIARQVTQDQTDLLWRYTVTDPDSDRPLHTGITRRRPTAAQRRHVTARDRTCIFPGCRMPSVDCDLDHRIPVAEGGPTTVDHLGPACRPHHIIRHRAGWTYRPLPNGDYLWTTKLGHRYTTSGRSP